MPPRRMPLAVAEATGSTLRGRPAGFQKMKPPDSPPLGPPGVGLGLLECGIWEEMRSTMWWLRAHHAPVFELFVRMVARMRRGETSNEVISGIMRCSRQLGADPTSDRIFGGLQDDDQEKDEFMD